MALTAASALIAVPVLPLTPLGVGPAGAQAATVIDLSVSPSSIGEGAQGNVTVTIKATLAGSATLATDTVVTLDSSLGGTATAGTDYTHSGLPGSLTILAGSSSASEAFTISPVQDLLDEDAGETVEISGSASDASVTVSPATLTITDDDTVTTSLHASASPSSINEADSATDVTITVRFGGTVAYDHDTTVTVNLSHWSTATKGSSGDYTMDPDPPGTITIPAGQLSGTTTVRITPIQDTAKERTETIKFWGYPIPNSGSAPGNVLLFDDDWRPPEAISFLASIQTGPHSARLSWSAPTTPAEVPLTGYILQRRPSLGHVQPVNYDPWERPGVVTVRLAPGATSYVAGGLACNTWYAWRLFAVNADGESLASNDSNVQTAPCPAGGTSGTDAGGGGGGSGSGGGGGGSGGGGSGSGGGGSGSGGGGGGSGGGGGGPAEEEAACAGALNGTVVLVNGWSAADIGVAAALTARTADAAVLYTSAGRLEPDAESALCALLPRRVVAIGGTRALAPAVLSAAGEVLPGADVSRVAGADRVDTAAQVAREALGNPAAGAGRVVVVANGWSAPDIGAAAALAARTPGAAVLLSSAGELPAATRRVIADYPVARVVVVGGEAVVSAEVFDAIAAAASSAHIERLTGLGRADTAAAVARRALGDAESSARRTLVIANGWRPSDVGIATALAARTAATAVAYTAPGELPAPTRQLVADYRPDSIVIIGGAEAVPDTVREAVAAAAPAARIERIDGTDRIHTGAQAAQWSAGAS